MTQMVEDIELIEHLDFEFAPPCEQIDTCDNEAAWKITVSCCFATHLFCTKCKDALLARIGGKDMDLTHSPCGANDAKIIIIESL